MSQLSQQCFAYRPSESKAVFKVIKQGSYVKVLSIKYRDDFFVCWISLPTSLAFQFGYWLGQVNP